MLPRLPDHGTCKQDWEFKLDWYIACRCRFTQYEARVSQDLTHKRGQWYIAEFVEPKKLQLRNVIRRFGLSADYFAPTVDNDPVFIRGINDFVNAKMVARLNLQSSFLGKFAGCRFRNALKGVNFAAGDDPASALRVLVPSSEQNLVGLIAN
jgi:hypothetical protein